VPRLKSHFYTLPCGVDLILGLNGFIWVSMHISRGGDDGEGGEGAADGFDSEAVYSSKNDVRPSLPLRCSLALSADPSSNLPQPIPPQTLRAIALVSNIILLLARNNMDIHPASIAEAYDILLEGEGGEAVQGAISDEAGEGVIMALRAGALS
jgi:exosome complex component RRP4